jgi:hypothetical protein
MTTLHTLTAQKHAADAHAIRQALARPRPAPSGTITVTVSVRTARLTARRILEIRRQPPPWLDLQAHTSLAMLADLINTQDTPHAFNPATGAGPVSLTLHIPLDVALCARRSLTRYSQGARETNAPNTRSSVWLFVLAVLRGEIVGRP